MKVFVEKNINGRPDIIAINGDKKTAVEIETGNRENQNVPTLWGGF